MNTLQEDLTTTLTLCDHEECRFKITFRSYLHHNRCHIKRNTYQQIIRNSFALAKDSVQKPAKGIEEA